MSTFIQNLRTKPKQGSVQIWILLFIRVDHISLKQKKNKTELELN